MKTYSEQEICLLLMCALPAADRPLREGLYRKMMRALSALGTENVDPDAELDEQELVRLGCGVQEARAILARLKKRDVLMRYLRNLDNKGITVITRISPEYPHRLRRVLGDRAPLVLWCAGNLHLFRERCIALVGSRQLREKGKLFAVAAGNSIAEHGYTYCSGGAAGADTVGFHAAVKAGGSAVVFVADSLADCMNRNLYGKALKAGRLLLVSEGGFDEHFSTPRALSRNRLIHAMGEKTLVAQSDYGIGGTWNGSLENLKAGWSPVLVCNEEPEDPGTRGLVERGGTPVLTVELNNLDGLDAQQLAML